MGEFPIAFEAQHAVTNVSRSADVIFSTCLLSLPAKTFTAPPSLPHKLIFNPK